jgi:hypothetical protein
MDEVKELKNIYNNLALGSEKKLDDIISLKYPEISDFLCDMCFMDKLNLASKVELEKMKSIYNKVLYLFTVIFSLPFVSMLYIVLQ